MEASALKPEEDRMRITRRQLRKIIREALANEYQWHHANDENMMLKKEPGMEKSDRKNVSKYLKSLGLMS